MYNAITLWCIQQQWTWIIQRLGNPNNNDKRRVHKNWKILKFQIYSPEIYDAYAALCMHQAVPSMIWQNAKCRVKTNEVIIPYFMKNVDSHRKNVYFTESMFLVKQVHRYTSMHIRVVTIEINHCFRIKVDRWTEFKSIHASSNDDVTAVKVI